MCLILLALLTVAQVTHVHASDNDADHCTLCVAMHSVVPIVVMLVAVILVRIGITAPVPLDVRIITRCWYPSLFIRPPPVCC